MRAPRPGHRLARRHLCLDLAYWIATNSPRYAWPNA